MLRIIYGEAASHIQEQLYSKPFLSFQKVFYIVCQSVFYDIHPFKSSVWSRIGWSFSIEVILRILSMKARSLRIRRLLGWKDIPCWIIANSLLTCISPISISPILTVSLKMAEKQELSRYTLRKKNSNFYERKIIIFRKKRLDRKKYKIHYLRTLGNYFIIYL